MKFLANVFELSRGGDAANVRPMEGLRGFAVMLVFLVHYVTLIEPWISKQAAVAPLGVILHSIGHAGVDLFFVLSGFLIYGSLMTRHQRFGPYMARRVQRIYPAFAFVFFLYLGLSFLFPSESKIPADPVRGLVYLIQNFLLLPGLFPIPAMITVAWSLSYEMFFYLVIPGLIAVFRLRERKPVMRVLLLVALALGIAAHDFLGGGHIRLVMFVAGMLLHETMAHAQGPTPSSSVAFFAVVSGLALSAWPIGGAMAAPIKAFGLFGAFFVLCLACFRNPQSRIAQSFSWTPLRWLGNMSYSYYLLHGLTLKACFLLLGKLVPVHPMGSWVFWSLLPIWFIATLVSSAVLFVAVERPFSLTTRKSAGERSVRGAAN